MSLPQMYIYAGRIFSTERDRTYQSLTPDQKSVLVTNETKTRVATAFEKMFVECDQHDRIGMLKNDTLKHETVMLFSAILVLAEQLGLNPEQMYLQMQKAAHLAPRRP